MYLVVLTLHQLLRLLPALSTPSNLNNNMGIYFAYLAYAVHSQP